MTWNYDSYDLDGWKLTLPVDEDYIDGSGDYTDGTALEIKAPELEGFEAKEFFYYDELEGGMVFSADVDGALTSSSTKYTRTELREMDGTDRAAWSLEDGGTLSAHLKVLQLAQEYDGDDARVIIGQIHGENDELVRLYYDASGNLYYANEKTGSDGDERLFYFENETGEAPNVDLGEDFSYLIDVNDGKLDVQIYADGEIFSAVPTDGVDPTEITDDWNGDTFYFKAGVYQGVTRVDGHSHEGEGTASALFYDIDYGHDIGGGREAWLGDDPEPLPEIEPISQPEPVPVSEPEPEPEPEPEAVLEPAPQPEPETEYAPVPEPESEPGGALDPQPQPEQETVSDPEPTTPDQEAGSEVATGPLLEENTDPLPASDTPMDDPSDDTGNGGGVGKFTLFLKKLFAKLFGKERDTAPGQIDKKSSDDDNVEEETQSGFIPMIAIDDDPRLIEDDTADDVGDPFFLL